MSAVSRSGYFVDTVLEQSAVDRLSTVRMVPFGDKEQFVDLLFASSGIESEVVSSATNAEIAPGLVAPVATVPSLIALKVLSANWELRPQDVLDLQQLISSATDTEIEESRRLLSLIEQRGYNRNKDLQSELTRYLADFRTSVA